MSKQWLAVLAVLAGLGLGATALVKYGPGSEPVAVGARRAYAPVDLTLGPREAM